MPAQLLRPLHLLLSLLLFTLAGTSAAQPAAAAAPTIEQTTLKAGDVEVPRTPATEPPAG